MIPTSLITLVAGFFLMLGMAGVAAGVFWLRRRRQQRGGPMTGGMVVLLAFSLMSVAPLAILTAATLGAGLIRLGLGVMQSGQWTDDPNNWTRTFDEPRPFEGIRVVHSWYKRTPHFTDRHLCFFELSLDSNGVEVMTRGRDLHLSMTTNLAELGVGFPAERPAWFKPEPAEAFTVYRSWQRPNQVLWIERNGSRAFYMEHQF